MLYAILGEDNEDSLELRMANRPAHLERIATLKNEGRLVLAGPHPAVDSEVAVEFFGPDKPAVLRKPGYVYLVLPMKI